VHSTPDGRFALLCLLVLAACVALARRAEQRFAEAARPTAERALSLPLGPTAQGDRLRDGDAIDPNLASTRELELLPGVGPSLARQIVGVRRERGPFRRIEELRQVRGIGARTLEKLRPFLRLASEGLEHPAQAQRDVARAPDLAALEQRAGAYVESERPAAREQVVGAEHELAGGQEVDAAVSLPRDE